MKKEILIFFILCNLCIFFYFLITTQMFFHHFFSFSLLLFMLLYNINIIILSFMDLTSLLILLLSQHLISQFSSNRNWNFFLILYRIFLYKFLWSLQILFFIFAHIEIIINIFFLCVISLSVSFHSVSYFFFCFCSLFKNLRVQRNTTPKKNVNVKCNS